MTDQTLQTLSQVFIAVGVIMTGLGGYGAYHYQKKIDAQKKPIKPVIDLCRRGISVTEIGDEKMYFDIPYCSGKSANAYNVKLETGVIVKAGNGFKVLAKFEDSFPDNITLSYETGKSMSFSLHPLTQESVPNLYIGVRGSYTDESGTSTHPVFDVFKFNLVKKEWVRTLGDEDKTARAFFTQMV